MQVPSSSVGPHNAKKNPTILTESTDHGVSQMLMLYAKPQHFTNEVCLQGGWVGREMVQNMLT